jgi:hypothetical protein
MQRVIFAGTCCRLAHCLLSSAVQRFRFATLDQRFAARELRLPAHTVRPAARCCPRAITLFREAAVPRPVLAVNGPDLSRCSRSHSNNIGNALEEQYDDSYTYKEWAQRLLSLRAFAAMSLLRSALFTILAAALCTPAAEAAFSIGSPTTDWVAVPYGPTALGDLKLDHQTGQGEADIVGNTGSFATSLPSFYFKFVAGATPTSGTMHYRVRVGGDQSPSGYKSVLLIGLDANKDGKLDLFLGLDNSGQSNGLYIWRPGTGLNISPSTTSMQSRTPVKKYTTTSANYHWDAVTAISATPGVVLDPTANTPLRQDFNAATGPDYLLSFSIPFADLVAALGAQGITFNASSAVTYVMGTATQAQAFNQDLNGVSGGTTSGLTWGALGVLTQPVTADGTVVNNAPVNTVSGSRTANGSLAVTGVSVNDPDGNLATVNLTGTNGNLSVSLTALPAAQRSSRDPMPRRTSRSAAPRCRSMRPLRRSDIHQQRATRARRR